MKPFTPFRSIAAAALTALVLPAAADAAITQQVHNDAAAFVPITPGLSISNMDPKVTITSAPEDAAKYYKYAVTGPDGSAVAVDNACLRLQFGAISRFVRFAGNGAYTMTTSLFSDNNCTTAAAGGTTGSFAINAGAVIQTPTTALLTRDPNSFSTKSYNFPTAVSPFGRQQILFKNNGVFDPAFGISGATAEDTLFAGSAGAATVFFREPGRYLFTTRARAGSPEAFTPWTAPQFVTVKAPFDLESSRFTDSRGPSYRIRLLIREKRITGKLSLQLRRVGGKYKTIGRPKVRRGLAAQTFRAPRSGRYQLRVTYKGSSLVAPGRFTIGFRITRRII